MSEALQVFINANMIPDIAELQKELSEEGIELESWGKEINSLHDIDGFWPGRCKGKDAGFEFSMAPVDLEDLEAWDVAIEQLGGRKLMMELCYYSEHDLVVAVSFIDVICQRYDGITFDENDELTVTAKNSGSWKREMLRGLE